MSSDLVYLDHDLAVDDYNEEYFCRLNGKLWRCAIINGLWRALIARCSANQSLNASR